MAQNACLTIGRLAGAAVIALWVFGIASTGQADPPAGPRGPGRSAESCAEAVSPLPIPSVVSGTTLGALADPEASACTTTITAPGVWFTVFGTGTTITASLCGNGTTYDSKINVYCGLCDQLICVRGNDDFCSTASQVSWCSEPGAQYFVLVQGFNGAVGDFLLQLSENGLPCAGAISCTLPTGGCCFPDLSCAPDMREGPCVDQGGVYLGDGAPCNAGSCQSAPPNDDCPAASSLPPSGTAVGTTFFAAADPDAPDCGTSISAPGVWYQVFGTGNQLTVTTCAPPTNYDTKVNVYCSGCDVLTCVGGNDDQSGPFVPECNTTGIGSNRGSTFTWCSNPGDEYVILVQGFNGQRGDYGLSVSDDGVACSPPPTCIGVPPGACCLSDGACADGLFEPDCIGQGGVFQGDGSLCTAGLCASATGTCCLGEACQTTDRLSCEQNGGTFLGAGIPCDEPFFNPCGSGCESCPGDMNGDGQRDGDDIQQMADCIIYSGGRLCPCADMDGDNLFTPADIPPFVQVLLQGTPCALTERGVTSDMFPTSATVVVEIIGMGPMTLQLFPADPTNTQVRRIAEPYQNGETVPIEMVRLELVGQHPQLGRIILHERADMDSMGAISQVQTDPSGNFLFGNAFLGTFVEIELPDRGWRLTTGSQPVPIEAQGITQLPPIGRDFVTPGTGVQIPLFLGSDIIGFIRAVIHRIGVELTIFPFPTVCPSIPTQCPLMETQCPPIETQCPAVETTCPAQETLCPAEETRCPVVQTECPETPVETECPTIETECPVVETECPLEETVCPEQETMCPVITTVCPEQDTMCPEMTTVCPEQETTCPVTPTMCDVTCFPEAPTVCPESASECPEAPTLCPVMQTTCPETATFCPEAPTECPAIATECPESATQCPVMTTECPVLATVCPEMTTQCPETPTECPFVFTECPAEPTFCEPTVCPPQPTACPPSDPTVCEPTRCPPSTTECPPDPTNCSPFPTECPTTPTQCPEDTVCPQQPTWCPRDPTRCPQDYSICPPVETICGQVRSFTFCSPVETYCPPTPTACQEIQTYCPPCPPCTISITNTPSGFIPQGRAVEGTATGDPGNTVVFTATVTAAAPRKIRFFLQDVSDEPGVCINFGDETVLEKDLKFRQTATVNPPGVFEAPEGDGQEIQTRNKVNSVGVVVTSYDYGAFGKIRACCLSDPDGLGLGLEICESFSEVRMIPIDMNNNHIADAATLNDTGPAGGSGANDDTDNDPALGTAGDGLTRYEEYRGVKMILSHFRLFPWKKEVFVHDADSIGLGYYRTSNMLVFFVEAADFNGTASRVINFKNSSHHLVDQHGLWLRNFDLGGVGSWGEATGANIGSPRENPQIRVDVAQIRSDMQTESANWQTVGNPYRPPTANDRSATSVSQTIAHELGHGIALDHHGQPETFARTHLGDAECVMRYFFLDMRGSANAAAFNAVTIGTTFKDTAPENCRSDMDVSDAP